MHVTGKRGEGDGLVGGWVRGVGDVIGAKWVTSSG